MTSQVLEPSIFGKFVCDKCPINPCHFLRVQNEKDKPFVRHIVMNIGCMLNPYSSGTDAGKVLEELPECFGQIRLIKRKCLLCKINEKCYDKRQELRQQESGKGE